MRRFGFVLLALFSLAADAHAQWFPDGTAINTAPFTQEKPVIVTDGAGGAVIAWADERNGDWDIYAQRVSQYGVLLWNPAGVPVVTGIYDQINVAAVADGSGGAIFVWVNDPPGGNDRDLYAQHLTASGTAAWGAGVPISTSTGSQQNPVIVSDNEGGAIVAWEDFRNGNWDVYAQRVNFLGSGVWTSNGAAVVTQAAEQSDLAMIEDGLGGAIVVWEDLRDLTDGEIYAQRKNSAGADLWVGNGKAATSGAFVYADYGDPVAASNDQSGVFIAWQDGITDELRVQQVDFFGNVAWSSTGLAIGPHLSNGDHAIIPDGSGGAIMAWDNQLSLIDIDVFAQRIDVLGAKQWGTNGVNVSDAPNTQRMPAIASDGQNGVVVVWSQYDNTTLYDLYVQRVSASGVTSPGPGGEAVSTAAAAQIYHAITSGSDAIVAWADGRNGITNYDIYAARIVASATGVDDHGPSLESLTVLPNMPNPFELNTTIRFVMEEASDVTLELFDVAGRRVLVLGRDELPAGSHTLPLSAYDSSGDPLPSGVYMYRLSAAGRSVTRKLVICR